MKNPASTHKVATLLRTMTITTLLAVSLLGLSACSDGGGGSSDLMLDPNSVVPPASERSIADTLNDRPDYGILFGLIERADLSDALNDSSTGNVWTLFAPPDTAFNNEAYESLTTEQKIALVKNHLYSGKLLTPDLQPGVLSMTQGSINIVEVIDGLPTVGAARIVARDREFSNGVIHYVDSILQAN